MAKTPEGIIKDLTNGFLHERFIFGAAKATSFPDCALGWYFYPAANGYGASGIPDIIGQYKGIFFALEIKRPGRRGHALQGCSPWQHAQLNALKSTDAIAFRIDCELDLKNFWWVMKRRVEMLEAGQLGIF